MIGSTILHKSSCNSSMDWAKEVAPQAAHGTLLLADVHRSPRGRHGRQWYAQPGQLLLTYILKPTPEQIRPVDQVKPAPLHALFMGISNSILAPLRALDARCVLKWPNDVYINNKKLAGVIIEPLWMGETLCAVIVGIGANINNVFAEGGTLGPIATSIREHSEVDHDLTLLQEAVSAELTTRYSEWEQRQYHALYTAWRDAQGFVGRPLSVNLNNGTVMTGVMDGVRSNGDLIIRTADGKRQDLAFTDVVVWTPL